MHAQAKIFGTFVGTYPVFFVMLAITEPTQVSYLFRIENPLSIDNLRVLAITVLFNCRALNCTIYIFNEYYA